ncbi:hypothetical protein SDC9_187761 [bioreactor metagenome]|uniref:Uncharacterized protein n=1 Tax=bioreactor metagenome TaxID=1076179 RepID=A0A645HMF0_9ZZZZ
MPFWHELYTIGRTPFIPLILPSRESSPAIRVFSRLSWLIAPMHAKIPAAIGKSNKAPSFFISAGARLTVILLTGNVNPEFVIAVLTRSLDSLTAESGSPTISKTGKP